MWFTGGPETRPSRADGLPREPVGAGAAPRRAGRAAAAAAGAALRCRRGNYSLEFAMVASGVLMMILGAVEMAWQGLTAVAVENALLQASRAGALGCLQPDGTRAGQAGLNQIRDAAHKAGGGILRRDALTVEPTAYSSLTNAASKTGGAKNAAGTAGQTVVYTLTYDQPFVFVGGMIGRRTYTHGGTVTVKNEPFATGGASAQPCS